jgi:adenine-specific DNA-methyltransferase
LKGRPNSSDGPGTFVRVQSLAQYDDALENLDTDLSAGESIGLLFDDPAFALCYRLDKTTRALYCGIDRFSSPFGYRLKRAAGGGEAKSCGP